MSYSKLVEYVKLSPNCTKPRGKKIDTITIHHAAGNASVETMGNIFAPTSRKASANYGIGSDGRVACYVEEENRAWTSSSTANDNRAITIEVANCGGAPDWPISDKAYAALLDLCEDICRRHGFTLNFTGDKSGNLTMHKWFKATACPGPYLESKFPDIAREVNARLQSGHKEEIVVTAPAVKPDTAKSFDKAKAGTYRVKSADGVLNLRAGASSSKALIEAMPNGTKVTCYGYYTGSWLFVVSESGKKGFCHSAYLTR